MELEHELADHQGVHTQQADANFVRTVARAPDGFFCAF
jgi:hypothetical protein